MEYQDLLRRANEADEAGDNKTAANLWEQAEDTAATEYPALYAAASELVDVLSSAIRFNLGASMSCSEIEAFATFMRALGRDEGEVGSVIDAHAESDEPDEWNAHYVKNRLEAIRQELRAERIAMSELAELQSLAEHIDPGDVELLEAAGVPEYPDEDESRVEPCALCDTPTRGNYEVQAEPEGGLGFVRSWVFLCEKHAP